MRPTIRIIVFSAVMCTTAPIVMAQPQLGGFVETIQAVRVEFNRALDPSHDFLDWDHPRSEIRSQLSMRDSRERSDIFVRIDVIGDNTQNSSFVTSVDLREAFILLRAARWLDIKAGQQVATWGTGDLVFANDLFPKDWVAFFVGLDDSYLKRPQSLLRISIYSGRTTFEWAVSPRFTQDRIEDPDRISLYDPLAQTTVESGVSRFVTGHAETAARFAGRIGDSEWALYGYWGHWPVPVGVQFDQDSAWLYHPELAAWGASIRLPLGSFLSHAEFAYYHSLDDPHGNHPWIANSELRAFAGTEKSLGREWTAGTQYFVIWTTPDNLAETDSPGDAPRFDELRSTATVRITKWAMHQTLMLSVFAFWGITDQDYHARPLVTYLFSDAVSVSVGASIIGGDEIYTTFGQYQGNSNAFARLRFSF